MLSEVERRWGVKRGAKVVKVGVNTKVLRMEGCLRELRGGTQALVKEFFEETVRV